jgi:large subunit ribosomal protein L13
LTFLEPQNTFGGYDVLGLPPVLGGFFATQTKRSRRRSSSSAATPGIVPEVVGIMKTYSVKAGEIQRDWYVVDAKDQVLGRLATEIAHVLRGKHKPTFSPHLDLGDYVVVINAAEVRLTGKKAEQKEYFRHSGYMGGERLIPFRRMIERYPERVIRLAVKGMLPKNTLGRAMLKKLKVYPGPEHPHAPQRPQPLATFAG